MASQFQPPQKEDDLKKPTRAMQWFGLVFIPLLSIISVLVVFFLVRDRFFPISLITVLINSPALCFIAKRMARFLFPLDDNERMLEVLKSMDDQKAKKIKKELIDTVQELLAKKKKPF